MSTDPSLERFDVPITIGTSDIDEHGHVNNVVYLRWVQEAAAAHWRAAATASQQAAVSWFVVRHEIDYKHPARLGAAIIARTLWCPVELRTGKPTRVGADIRERFSVPSAEEQSAE